MLQNSRCGTNAAIETKEICEELREYFINNGAVSWQRKQSLGSSKLIFLCWPRRGLYSTFSCSKNKLEKYFLSKFSPNFIFVAAIKQFFTKTWKYRLHLVCLSYFLLIFIFTMLIVNTFEFVKTLSFTKKELLHKPVIATPRLSLFTCFHEQRPFSTLSQLAKPLSLIPYVKCKS